MLLARLCEMIAAYLPERRIVIDGELYLQRFYLFGKMPDDLALLWNCGVIPKQRIGFLPTTYLHRFHKPDKDRACHNHPWSGRGLILVGGYIEERWSTHPAEAGAYKYMRVMAPFARQKLEADTFHRVASLLVDGPIWTIFQIGEYQQKWGYWIEEENRFIPYNERHADPNAD